MFGKTKQNKFIILLIILAFIVRLTALFYLHDYNYMMESVVSQGEVARNILDGSWFYINSDVAGCLTGVPVVD